MHSAVTFLFDEISRKQRSVNHVMKEAGFSPNTAAAWKNHSPCLDNLEACLNVVGYTLVPVPIGSIGEVETVAQHRIAEAIRVLNGR